MMLPPACRYCRQARVMWKNGLNTLVRNVRSSCSVVSSAGLCRPRVVPRRCSPGCRCGRSPPSSIRLDPFPQHRSRRRRHPRAAWPWRPSPSTRRRGFLRVVVFLKIKDRDVGALARHRDRDRAADAAVASSDDRDPFFQLSGARVLRHVFRPRPHRAFDARADGPAPAAAGARSWGRLRKACVLAGQRSRSSAGSSDAQCARRTILPSSASSIAAKVVFYGRGPATT